MTTSAREERELVVGVDEDTLETLDLINTDPDSFVEGYLDDAHVTIIGMQFRAGGETRTNGRGEEFLTRDQLIVQYRVDDIEGIDATVDYLSLPPKFQAKDGTWKRREVTSSSDYGAFLGQLAALGVSSNENIASVYHYGKLSDLLGLQFHRQLIEVEGYNNQVRKLRLPVEIDGFDNEFRAEQGLAAANANL